MTNWAIDDMHGNEICAGLSEDEAREAAQRAADRLGQSVYLYELGSDGEPEEVDPASTENNSHMVGSRYRDAGGREVVIEETTIAGPGHESDGDVRYRDLSSDRRTWMGGSEFLRTFRRVYE